MFCQLCHGFDLSKIMYTLLTLIYFSCFVTIPLQWGTVYWGSSDMETKFTFPIEFSEGMISAVAADTGGGSQGFGIHPIDTKSADIYRSGEGYNGSCRLVLIGK